MAQLPPKIPPSMTPNWPNSFPHQRMPPMVTNIFPNTTTTTTANHQQPPQQQPSWVDEFLDFSSARRGSHRRSISDSIAFLEAPIVEERRNNSSSVASIMHGGGNINNGNNGFDRLDDEQLMSMFSDDMSVTVPPTVSTSNPSTPSDQNSNNDEIKPNVQDHQQHQKPKNEPEVESSCKSDPQAPPPSIAAAAATSDTIIDPKRVKRILANRQSAQRSRVRKLQYISELERSVTSLQTEVSALSPRVAFLDHQRLILNVDNSALKQRIAALAQDKIFKDAHQEALKKEIERLRQVYHHQNLKKMSNNSTNDATNAQRPLQQQPPQQPPISDNMDCTDKDQPLS